MIRYKGVLIGKIPDFVGRRMIGSDDLPDVLWNAGHWISPHHGLKVILPDRLLLVVCMRRPEANAAGVGATGTLPAHAGAARSSALGARNPGMDALNEMEPWTGDEGGQALHELQW
jgi:hypothetical protein